VRLVYTQISPGHILTTLYMSVFSFSLPSIHHSYLRQTPVN